MSDYNIREAFEKIEDELIDSMMRNFSRHRAEETKEGYNWTQWQAEQLKSLKSTVSTTQRNLASVSKPLTARLKR